jgi:hypothetical protein
VSDADQLVIVLGAGASKEVKLPTGTELVDRIADVLDFPLGAGSMSGHGSREIYECLHRLAQAPIPSNKHDYVRGSAEQYFNAAKTIRNAMPLAPSIDNFIDSRRDISFIAEVGKFAISSCILEAERASLLFVDYRNSRNRLDFSVAKNTWFEALFKLMCQHCSPKELMERFSRLTIISFNYDRCAWFYFREAFRSYYELSETQAEEILSKVKFYYPYGSVGEISESSTEVVLRFGDRPTSDQLTQSAARLKTFTEGTDHGASQIDAIRNAIAGTKTLIFLGFAFHPLNLKLLYGQSPAGAVRRDCEVIATAMGISDSDKDEIVTELLVLAGYPKDDVHLHQGVTAAQLISMYGRRLARAVQTGA